MKNTLKNTVAFLAMALALVSCTKDSVNNDVSGTGSLKIQYENGFADNLLVFGSATVPTSNNEVLKISKIKYIVSNIVLIKEDGSTFTYPKSQSYFIVDEATPASLLLNLTNIPAGNYKAVKFGIGVDQDQFNLGATNQINFWDEAQVAGMASNNWADGFKHIVFEGTFTSPTITTNTPFIVHTGQTGTDYNYTEVSLDLPTNALVRNNITPQIHLSTDLSQLIDGAHKISLSANSNIGTGAILDGANLTLVTENISEMFSVEHVHNDPN
jgi:hypothetical protein